MAGEEQVSAEYYRRWLAALGFWFGHVQDAAAGRKPAVAGKVRLCARVLMRCDGGPEITAAEFAEAERLIDASAGYLTRLGLDAASVRRRAEAEALGPVGECKRCRAVTVGTECAKCSAEFLAMLERIM